MAAVRPDFFDDLPAVLLFFFEEAVFAADAFALVRATEAFAEERPRRGRSL